MGNNQTARLHRLEAVMNRVRPKLLSIVIVGGLPGDRHENFAQAGDMLWEREANETVADFQRRAREAALSSGQRFIVFGGLPDVDAAAG